MSFVSRAKAAYLAGHYAQAVALYEQAIVERPELTALYRFNLNLARDKMGLPSVNPQSQVAERTRYAVTPTAAAEAGTVTFDQLFQEVNYAARALPRLSPSGQPLVSVLMTSHNVEEYIEDAITSVLRQTWPRLELVIVDDASEDGTWEKLRRLVRTDARLRIQRLNANLGTYYAKNLALTLARGQVIFFQDGDDISHPERIRLGMHALGLRPESVCVRGAYARVLWPSGQVLPVNGEVRRLGLITLGVQREVFDKIGYFNPTTKASDEEFFNRLKAAYSGVGLAIVNLPLSTYYNTLRDGSLFSDMVANNPAQDGYIEQVPSPSRQVYVDTFRKYHSSSGSEEWVKRFNFPTLRDPLPVTSDMTLLSNPKIPVVVSLCSIPERADLLQKTLVSLAPQCDEIHLYLDRYEAIPNFVKQCHPKVNAVLSKDVPGLRDNGKFLPVSSLSQPCYFITCDDDIIYPVDYVHAMVKKIEYYGRQAVVGVHGVLVPEQPHEYFSGYRKVFHFRLGIEADQLVNNLGTGTMACFSGTLKGLDPLKFSAAGMADLCVASWCRQRGIPMVAISRHEGWLQEMNNDTPNLFDEFSQADDQQVQLLKADAPWGYAAVADALKRLPESDGSERLRRLLPVLTACLK